MALPTDSPGRVGFPVPFPTGVPVPPSQSGLGVQTPAVQRPRTLGVAHRQYPNLDPKWFTSPEAHGGMTAAIRSLYDMNFDLQDGIRLLTSSNPGVQVSQQNLQGSGAVNPSQRAHYLITAPAAAALTLGPPRAGLDDGTELTFSSSTAFAHTITTPGALQTGSAHVNTATFPAFAGASLHLRAQGGKWNVMSSNTITFS